MHYRIFCSLPIQYIKFNIKNQIKEITIKRPKLGNNLVCLKNGGGSVCRALPRLKQPQGIAK